MRAIAHLSAVVGILAVTASQALAYDCMVANKPVGAGSAATINIDSGAVTPSKRNPGTEDQTHGGFVTLTGIVDGQTVTGDTFVHARMKAGAPQAEHGVIPGATKQEQQRRGCDGKGLETFEACMSAGAF